MPLIVETGENVPNANSYISLVDARALAISMGLAFAGSDPEAEAALSVATSYLESFRSEFQGHTTNGAEQPLAWPRKLVNVDNQPIAENVIPLLLQKAQVVAATLIRSAVNLFPADDGKFITEDTVDVITTKYSEKLSRPGGQTRYPQLDAYLRPLLTEQASATELRRF